MLLKSDNPNVINIASIGAYALQKCVLLFTRSDRLGELIRVGLQEGWFIDVQRQ